MSELRKAAGAVVKTSAALAKSADGLMASAVGEVPQAGGGGKARSGGDTPRRRRRDDQAREPEYVDPELEEDWELGR